MERRIEYSQVEVIPVVKKDSYLFKGFMISLLLSVLCNILVNINFLDFSMFWFNRESFNFPLAILSVVIFLPIIWLLLSVFNNILMVSLSLITTSILFAIANSNKLSLRNEPVYPMDLNFLTTIDDLLLMIDPVQKNMIIGLCALIIILIIILTFLHFKLNLGFFSKNNKTRKLRSGIFLVSILSCLYLSNFSNPQNLVTKFANFAGFSNTGHQQKLLYEKNGFIFGFLNNLPGSAMKKPDNYNRETVFAVLDKYHDDSTDFDDLFTDTSVIYILSESFSDPNMVNGINMNYSPIDYITDPFDKVYSGNVIVPSYGGGTTNAEFEVLTGLSIQYLLPNMALPFQDFLSSFEFFPSIVSDFVKNPNNDAISLHSFTSEMYRRRDVYKSLGINKQMYRDNMIDPTGVDESIYVSDRSVYDNLLTLINENGPLFINTVTMQNHSPYFKQFDGDDYRVLDGNIKRAEEIENYAQGISITDHETRLFIEEISKLDEKVIVVFYGDHLPGLYDQLSDINTTMDLARTPFFIYSNFSNLHTVFEQDQSLTNINNLVKNVAGVKKTPIDSLIYELRLNVPSGRFDQYLNEFQELVTVDELTELQQELINDYILIQYDIITGSRYSLEY